MDQTMIRTVIMRGGSSKALFLRAADLPADPTLRDRIILRLFGSPDRRQIDGLGGADPLTSKLAIISPPSRPDADLDYLFGQVHITEPVVDYRSVCGNISAAVAAFAVDEGMVRVSEPVTLVRIHNLNSGKLILAEVPVRGGKAATEGDFVNPGVPGTGAEIVLNFAGMVGANTGALLPTGSVMDTLAIDGIGKIRVSIVDVGNCTVFVQAADIGMDGREMPNEIDSRPDLLALLEEIRGKAAELAGIVTNWRRSREESPATPLLAVVSEPREYVSLHGAAVRPEDVDLVARMMFMQVTHKAYAGTGAAATGVATRLPGTVPNEVLRRARGHVAPEGPIRIGHPGGVLTTSVRIEHDGTVRRATFSRTARRLMEGYAFVPWSVVKPEGRSRGGFVA